MCSLSGNQPFFCDGSHKKTADEAAGKVYVYHEDRTRKKSVMLFVAENCQKRRVFCGQLCRLAVAVRAPYYHHIAFSWL